MARAAKKDPTQTLLDELATARDEGLTDLSVNVTSPEVMLAVCEVTSLTELRLNGDLTSLPPQIGQLIKLKRLSMEQNKLTALPPEIGKLVALERLYAYHNELAALPDEIGDMVALEKIVLWKNHLRTLPAAIGRLANLTELDLKWNEIETLPPEIGRLTKLVELNLESNQLADLPREMSGMTSLRELKLGKNKLTAIPEAVLGMPALAQLYLKENQIRTIPDGITRMARLRDLSLDSNLIETLPEALFATSVSVLNLAKNRIRELPRSIGTMKSLIELKLDDNPLDGVPEEVLEGGKDALFDHFGLIEPRTVTGDLPEPAARDAIVKANKQALEDFVRSTKRRMTDEKMRDRLLEFFTGKTDRVPPGRIKDHYSFGSIVDVLAPYPEWTFVDRRIITFIAQEGWQFIQPGHDYTSGYHGQFFNWANVQIKEETDDRLFGKLADELCARGVDRAVLLRQSLIDMRDNLVRSDGSPTSFGRWVLENAGPAAIIEVAQAYRSVKGALTPLLLDHAPQLFERVASDLLAYVPNDKGEVHLAPDALYKLCKSDPAGWESMLDEGLSVIGDCLPCNADACRILGDCYPAHRDRALAMATNVLAVTSSRRNKEQHFQLHWSLTGWNDGTASFIDWMLTRFGDDARPAITAYAEDTKVFLLEVAEVVARALGQAGVDILSEGLNMSFDSDSIAPHFRQMFAILAPLDWSKYHDKAWQIATCDVRQVRQVACLALARLPVDQVFDRAKALLGAKKAAHREAGVMILGLLDHPPARRLLDNILDDETSDDVRDVAVLGVHREVETIDVKAAQRRVASAAARGKLAAPAAKWADDKKLPALAWARSKKPVEREVVRFLLHRQTRHDDIAPEPEARDIYPLIARNGAFASKLLAAVLANGGAKAKNRFALTLVGLLGDDSVVDTLEKVAIDDRNVNAVRTLGLLRSRAAAAALDRIARAFRTKYPNVREPAQDAFAEIADSMRMTPFELADAMLPDLGFGGKGRTLELGKRAIDVVIGADRKVTLREAGKVLRTPPKDLTAKHKAELKQLGVDLKETMRGLRASLEYYLIVQRRWSAADWRAFFVDHPVARAFARSLVWAIDDGKGAAATFRLTGDAGDAVVGVDGVPVKLRDGIGLVHPLDLSPEQRAAWQATLDAEELVPAFLQMTRPVFAVSDAERDLTLLHRVEGREVNTGTFKSRAERLGWRRGSVIDSGEVSAYRKLYPTSHIEVFLRLEGLNVQAFDVDAEATLQEFLFVRQGSIVTGSYTYDEPRDRQDPRLIPAGMLPAIVFSETIGDLEAITRQKAEADQ